MSMDYNDDISKNANDFAEACYDQNSISELQEALDIVDLGDIEDPEEWRIAIKMALREKLNNLTERLNDLMDAIKGMKMGG